MTSDKFTPLRVEPPTKAGTEDLGEMSKELKALHTLVELYISEENEEKRKPKEKRDAIFLAELSAKREIVLSHFRLEFFKKYKENISERFAFYSDWHVYRVPFVIG
jgi:hypothetical protein